MGLPWAMLPDRSVHDALSTPDGAIIDRLYADKLGVDFLVNLPRLTIIEHASRASPIVRTFTQSPYVFTSLRNASLLSNRTDDNITYELISG
jgi:putative ABC transport system permease protein